MKYIKLFLESKNLGNLYHIVDIEKLNYILDNNKIESYKAGDGKISLTRNKMMTGYLGDNSSSVFKLEIDGDKLSSKYRIRPYRYKTRNAGYLDEYEEQVQTNKIINIFDYTNRIIIDKKRVLNLMNSFYGLSDWFTSEGTRHGTFPNVLKTIKEKLDRLGLELYVQDGSIIKKDDKWIDYIINFPIKKVEKRYFIILRKRIEIGKYRYQDSLVDFNNNIIIKDLVIGHNIEINPDRIKGIELKSFEESKKFKFDEDDEDSKHYFLEIRKLDDDNWKIDNIRPII
jgi:hypothetical protein